MKINVLKDKEDKDFPAGITGSGILTRTLKLYNS